MGPFAGCRFLEWIFEAARDEHGARRNEEFPHVIVGSVPVADLVSSNRDARATVDRVEAEVDALARAGAEVFAIACHTMHAFLPRLASRATGPMLSMPRVVASALRAEPVRPRRIGLLAAPLVIRDGLYHEELSRLGIEVITPSPSGAAALTEVILRAIGGVPTASDQHVLYDLMRDMGARGADAALLACTELALFDVRDAPIPAYEPLRFLARAACDLAYGADLQHLCWQPKGATG